MKITRRANRLAILCLSIAAMASCSDDAALPAQPDGDVMTFGISMADGWNTPSRSLAEADTVLFDNSDFGLIATAAPITAVPASRAAEISDANFYDSFRVFGYVYQGSPFDWRDNARAYMADERAYSKGNGIWGTDRTYFWPDASCRMRFLAIAPYDMPGLTLNGLTPRLDYEVPDEATAQKDLMYAVADVEGDYRKNLTLQFGHMLTAVKIHAAQTLEATIKKVTLKNVRYTGSYDFDNLVWTVADDRKDFTFDCDISTNIDKPTSEPIADGDNTFMMLPQSFWGSPLELEITLQENNGELKKLTKQIAPYWEAGTVVDMRIWRSFRGVIHFMINNREQAMLTVMNVKPGLERSLTARIADFPGTIKEWSLSPEVDEFVTSIIWNINQKDITVYTRGAMLLFLPNNPDGAAVQGMPENVMQTGREYVYTFPAPKIPVCTGYTFMGWAKSPDRTTVIYQPGADITVSVEKPEESGYVMLYPVWEKD